MHQEEIENGVMASQTLLNVGSFYSAGKTNFKTFFKDR